ncbi:MAG: CRISPR-associated protein Cas4 [Bacteroidota bacterium]
MKNITGVMIQYYIACKRELWLYANQVNMNYDNEDISIGRLIHEKSYARETKSINLGEVAFDFVKKGKNLTIFEIKKSSKLKEPVRYQLYYYLWYVKHHTGNEVNGVLVYPEEKKREKLELTPEIEKEIEEIIENIKEIVSKPVPPPVKIMPYCKRCTYYELCMV